MSSDVDDYSTLNGEHDWEELGLRLRNQQTCTSENRN